MSGRIDLEGKVAVVTGAGRGLGRAYAEALAAAGAAVVVNDVAAEAAEETVALITTAGGRAVAEIAAVGSAAAADALVARAVESYGRLDTMVANAGVLRDKVLWKMTDEDFDLVIETHLRGTFTCARAAAVRYREQGDGGSLILVGSPAGQRGSFGQTNYAAAKAGIVSFARTWAQELARAEVTVNAIIPTAWTAMTATIPLYEPLIELLAEGGELPPQVRQAHAIGSVEDCASLVVFLASDAARDVTGQAIGIGGDRLALWTHPQEATTAFSEGGWTAAEIARDWSSKVGGSAQSYGLELPPLELGEANEGGTDR